MIAYPKSTHLVVLFAAFCLSAAFAHAAEDAYTSLLSVASQLLRDGKLVEARQAATTATSLAPDRFEAWFLAGAVAHQQGADAEARPLLEKSLTLAPADRKEKIQQFIASLGEVATAPVAPPKPAGPPALDAAAQREMDTLMVIVQEADSADTPTKRQAVLGEFLDKSVPFLKAHPEQAKLWIVRAAVALELEREKTAKRAGQKLQELGLGDSQDDKVRRVLAMLNRKGWLIPPAAAVIKTGSWPEPGKPFENPLGMKFVPVPGTGVLFSIWDTRVQDYQVFVTDTHRKWGVDVGTIYPKPQGPTYPAVSVSWDDAKAFCAWLTLRDQTLGRLSADQEYRLPTDSEWSAAIGLPPEKGNTPAEKNLNSYIAPVYPWGATWPPQAVAGNYADSSYYKKYRKDLALKADDYIKDYTDGHADASPVGSFAANKFGLFDMSGNVWQWCEDWVDQFLTSRVVRGGAFDCTADLLLSYYRVGWPASTNSHSIGFRCVVAMTSSEP